MTETTPPGGTSELAGRTVARIGYGAMQLGALGPRSAPDRDASIAVLRRVVELGVDHIDTAEFYGGGSVNELIRAALHPYADGLALVSKVGAVASGGTPRPAQRPEELRAGVEANLQSLGVEQLAVVNLRRMDDVPGVAELPDQQVDLDVQLAELVDLRDEGKIGGIGVSNVTLDQLTRALPAGVACVQNTYSVLNRAGEPMLDLCREHGIAWVPYFPLGSAFPQFPKVTDDPAVIGVAESVGATPAQVGLAWLLAHDEHVLLIPGTSSLGHLEDNVATADVRLDAEAMELLDGLAAARA